MVHWTDELLRSRLGDALEASVLDLGTGNGSFLLELAKLGYRNLSGCDYSEQSIALARAIAQRRSVSDIHWIQDDLLETKITTRSANSECYCSCFLFSAECICMSYSQKQHMLSIHVCSVTGFVAHNEDSHGDPLFC